MLRLTDPVAVDDPFLSRQASHFARHRLTAPAINLVVTGAMVALLWPVAAPATLLAWASAQVAINLARLVFLGSPAGSPAGTVRWARRHAVAAVITGATWGALAVVLFGLPQAYQAVALLVAGGMCMGALPMLAVVPRVYTLYLVAILGPLALGQFMAADSLQTIIGVLTLVTLASLWHTGRQLGKVIEDNFRLQVTLEALVRRDGLTGITNRRGFDEQFEAEWRRAVRADEPLSLALIDVDDFKRYNDHYGHPAGDECLKTVARALSAALPRASDLLARYGGEEFVVLLPMTGDDGARVVAERLRSAIVALAYPHARATTGAQVTVSIGLASIRPGRQQAPHDLLHAADQALYTAKAAGNNRVVSAKSGT
jgi:diguanylate cyclase (GGDEF)-like protein